MTPRQHIAGLEVDLGVLRRQQLAIEAFEKLLGDMFDIWADGLARLQAQFR